MPHPLRLLLENDPRYSVEAYEFVQNSLAYAQDVMGLGKPDDAGGGEEEPQRHLTGQELCEASRLYALDQYRFQFVGPCKRVDMRLPVG